eukprot:6158313-Pyramimonas_sp.AAC.1
MLPIGWRSFRMDCFHGNELSLVQTDFEGVRVPPSTARGPSIASQTGGSTAVVPPGSREAELVVQGHQRNPAYE